MHYIALAVASAGLTVAGGCAVYAFKDGWSPGLMIGVTVGISIGAIGFILASEALMPLPARILVGVGIVFVASGIVWALGESETAKTRAAIDPGTKKIENTSGGAVAMPDEKKGDVFNVTSHNQSGGITAGKIVVGQPARHVDAQLGGELRQKVPRGIPVFIQIEMGDVESKQFAEEISGFLKKEGYSVFDPIGVVVGTSFKPGIEIITYPNQTNIRVGAERRP
jgi:hypothetical protein